MERLQLDFNNMMQGQIGPHGLTDGDLAAIAPRVLAAQRTFMEQRGQGMMGWTSLPYEQGAVVEEILAYAQDIRARGIRNFVVLGIGGSSLGPIAVHQALNHLHYNELPDEKRPGPRLYVEDNIDPERMRALMDIIDVRETVFNVISKSGNTSETTSQFLIIRHALKEALGQDYASHIVCTTSRDSGSLVKIARAEGFRLFAIPDGVGGRFSETCPVGLLPAAVCGIDIASLLAGAADMDKRCQQQDMHQNPAMMAAALSVLSMEKGMNISVMMPYADSLRYVADWYAQLWGESLGKLKDTRGNIVRAGQTPVKSLGVTDQHSQLQLYAEGPQDKVITFLAVGDYRTGMPIPKDGVGIESTDFLCGHSLEELIQAERKATAYALTRAGQMNMTITLPTLNAHTLGQLLYYFQVQTALTGFMLGVDPFDQPGVENSKNATYAMLGRAGYDDKRRELEQAPKAEEKYRI
nr:glucose-6-phosphate isomerase [bacterium]